MFVIVGDEKRRMRRERRMKVKVLGKWEGITWGRVKKFRNSKTRTTGETRGPK